MATKAFKKWREKNLKCKCGHGGKEHSIRAGICRHKNEDGKDCECWKFVL